MGDVMNFPERIEDFIEQYSFRDDERTYTNGSMLIPVFRVKQAIEHYMSKWIPCSERFPPKLEENHGIDKNPAYLVSVNGEDYPYRALWNGRYFMDGFLILEAVAWQPLPEPYEGGREE